LPALDFQQLHLHNKFPRGNREHDGRLPLPSFRKIGDAKTGLCIVVKSCYYRYGKGKHFASLSRWTVSCKSACILDPHVFGILALTIFAVLLPSLAFEVAQVCFVVSITVVLTEFLELLQFFKNFIYYGIGTNSNFTHF
jgi:hypothetical protein